MRPIGLDDLLDKDRFLTSGIVDEVTYLQRTLNYLNLA